MTETSHIRRVFALLILALVMAFLAQRLFQPTGFGKLGHYRAGSLNDIMNLEMVHQGSEACRDCHPEIYAVHQKDIHFSVQCEDCHGPANLHIRHHMDQDASVSLQQATMPKEYTFEGCLFCHRKLVARPTTFAQVDRRQHYTFLHVSDLKIRCIDCHSPHEPLFLLEPVSQARIHPMIFECEDCHHETPPQESHEDVPDHPVIFVCGDCHSAIVEDFGEHEHSFLRCTACHLFYRVNETSGRILRNAHRQFCLLCHEEKPFKNRETLPQIVYSDHIAKMSMVMRRRPEDFANQPAVCLECHPNFAHDQELLQQLRKMKR